MDRITVIQLKAYLRSKNISYAGSKAQLYFKFLQSVEADGLNADDLIAQLNGGGQIIVNPVNPDNTVKDARGADYSEGRILNDFILNERSKKFQSNTNLNEQTGNLIPAEELDGGNADNDIKLGESASQVSRRSNSSVASMKANALVRKAALKARADQLKRKQQLQLKRQELKFQEEQIELETELAAASAEVIALDNLDRGQGNNKELGINKTNQFKLDKQYSGLNQTSIAAPCKDELGTGNYKSGDIDLGLKENLASSSKEFNLTESELIKNLISCNLKGFMPSQELKKFEGNYTDYFVFIRSFDSIIADKISSPGDKIHYLEQYTTGKANEIVRSCLHLDASVGYERARQLLEKRYGNREQITAAHIDRILCWPKIGRDETAKLDEFSIELASCQNALSCFQYGSAELDNPRTIRTLLEKLPFNLQDRWRRFIDRIINDSDRLVKFQDLVDFLGDEVRIMSNPAYGKHMFINDKDKSKIKLNENSKASRVSAQAVNAKKGGLACWHCNGNHILDNCTQMLKLDHNDKLKILYDLKLCFSCLRRGHLSSKCQVRKQCETCKGSHPTLLHKEQNSGQEKSFKDSDSSSCNPSATPSLTHNSVRDANSSSVTSSNSVGIFSSNSSGSGKTAVIPVKISLAGREIETRAFLDPGSTVSFIAEDLLRDFNLNHRYSIINLDICTITGVKSTKCKAIPGVTISDMHGNNTINLPPLYSISKIPVDDHDIIDFGDLGKWEHFDKIEFHESKAPVGLMLGTNAHQALEPWELVNSRKEGDPYAVRTKLGWYACGVGGCKKGMASVNRTNVCNSMDQQLIESYNRDFQDLASTKKQWSYDDRFWLNLVSSGCKYISGHYEIPLPLKDINCNLNNSKFTALHRLNSLKKKLSKDEGYFNQYKEFMDNLLVNNYAEIVPANDISKEKVWYVPHFGVYHPDKPDKIRVVFDCACKVNGLALNDLLMPGPDINNLLLGVLLRGRVGIFAYSADIQTMFYQVKVKTEHRDYLRYLWFQDSELDKKAIEYRMVSHPFGASSSPSVANFALKRAAEDFGSDYNLDISHTINNCFYVDDCIRSDDSISYLKENAAEVKSLCGRAGFNLTKFVSSSKEFLMNLENLDLGKHMESFLNNENVVTKILGLQWNLTNDRIGVSIRDLKVPKTKRDLLSLIAGIYDPLGIVSPLVLQGRVLMQELCRLRLRWDDDIQDSIKNRVLCWLTSVENHKNITVNRCIKPCLSTNIKSFQWHFFSDASLLGYGAVAYLRIVDFDESIYCGFVMGKCRVAPLKAVSVPRLELVAAVLSVKLKEILTTELGIDLDFSEVYMWTDSTTVLKYIKNDNMRYKTFVANRVTILRDGTEKCQWRYVSSKLNPAYDCSRARQSDRWLASPEFLKQPPCNWPVDPDLNLDLAGDSELKRETVLHSLVREVLPFRKLINYFSSWLKLVRCVAWYMLLMKSFNSLMTVKHLSIALIQQATVAVLIYEQKECFSLEYSALSEGKQLTSSSPLIKLKPLLVNGILRVGGRLDLAEISYDERHPIILPSKSRITDLIVEYFHVQNGHMGRQYVLSKLRTKYWVIKGNSVVRRVLSKCIKCRRFKSDVIKQEMAELPIDRAAFDKPPFYITGLDCFGPFYVKVGRAQVKRYGMLFTCLTSRAIHLEVAVDLGTDACVNAIRRFVARRGQIRKIKCDRGTNFISASKILKSQGQVFEDVSGSKLVSLGVEWEFNAPGASHFGGTWERMIGSVRRVLEVIMGIQVLSDDLLGTLFCEVEAIVNSRPLSATTSDANDLVPITPSAILNVTSSPVEFENNEGICYSKRRYKQVQYMANQFWLRWRQEYFLCLQQRQKWLKQERNVSPGDIVLVVDENLPRCHWPLARVTNVKFSRDNLVRSVHLNRGGKVIERPISKLIMLLEDDSHN